MSTRLKGSPKDTAYYPLRIPGFDAIHKSFLLNSRKQVSPIQSKSYSLSADRRVEMRMQQQLIFENMYSSSGDRKDQCRNECLYASRNSSDEGRSSTTIFPQLSVSTSPGCSRRRFVVEGETEEGTGKNRLLRSAVRAAYHREEGSDPAKGPETVNWKVVFGMRMDARNEHGTLDLSWVKIDRNAFGALGTSVGLASRAKSRPIKIAANSIDTPSSVKNTVDECLNHSSQPFSMLPFTQSLWMSSRIADSTESITTLCCLVAYRYWHWHILCSLICVQQCSEFH